MNRPQHAATDQRAEPDPRSTTTVAETRPIPPRFWWLKRLALAGVTFLIAMIAIRLWWGHYADSQLQAKLAEYRAAGQPVTIEDFQTDPIPDEENAAYYIRQAVQNLTPSPTDSTGFGPIDFAGNLAWIEANSGVTGQFVRSNRIALDFIREARARSKADWQLATGSALQTFNTAFSLQSSMRRLAKTEAVAATYYCATGHHAECVELLRDYFALVRHGSRQEPLISHLMTVATDAIGVDVVEATVPKLHIVEEFKAWTGEVVPARRAQLKALLDDVLQDRWLKESCAMGMYWERLSCLESMNGLTQGTISFTAAMGGGPAGSLDAPAVTLLSPAWKLDFVRIANDFTSFAVAEHADDYMTITQRLPSSVSAGKLVLPRDFACQLSNLTLQFYPRIVSRQMRALADHRMAAIALALRLYEVDHGARPDTLSALVPEYLPVVPIDPFDPAKQTLRYRPDAKPPVLYSVGKDGLDQGGAFTVSQQGDVERTSPDRVFFLDGDRPRRPIK